MVLAALAQIAGSPLGTAIAGRSVGEVSDGNRSLITPAGYAFSIWGVIFAGASAWAVYQALPGQRVRAVHRRTGWPLAAAFAGNAVWEVAFPLVGDTAPVVPAVLLSLIVATTALAWARLQDLAPEGWARLLPAAVSRWLHTPGLAYQVPVWHRLLRVRIEVVTPGFVRAAHAIGRQVHVWTINDAAQMHRLFDLGVDGIVTDRLDVLAQVLVDRGHPLEPPS